MTSPALPPPLAVPDDLLPVAFGPVDNTTAEDVLGRASAMVRSYCRWLISKSDYDVTLDSSGDRVILLPAMQVTAVSTVEVAGTAVTDFSWSESGVLEGCFPCGRRNVRVEFTAGFDPVPRDVVAAVCSAASRMLSTRGGWTQQRIGSLSLGQTLTAGGGLDDHEVALLAGYRLP